MANTVRKTRKLHQKENMTQYVSFIFQKLNFLNHISITVH